MKLRLEKIEAAYFAGGYLDIQTMDYIAPKWLHDTNPKYHMGLTNKQFEHIQKDSSRYLKLPLLRPAALRCYMALQLGISKDALYEAGIPQNTERDIIWANEQNIDVSSPNYSDVEMDILSAVSAILMRARKIDECSRLEDEFFAEMMCKWLSERNIELEVFPQENPHKR